MNEAAQTTNPLGTSVCINQAAILVGQIATSNVLRHLQMIFAQNGKILVLVHPG